MARQRQLAYREAILWTKMDVDRMEKAAKT
jgi:hypothetical protein